MKQVAVSESFAWATQLWPLLKQFENDGVSYYQVIASTADIKNRNGRIYTSEELKQAAASLSERPLNINHDPKRELPFPENQVVAARFESGHVECIIQVADPQVNEMIESRDIRAVSIEGMYLDNSKNTSDTEYPSSLHFQALALLTRDDTPGDPNARIILTEALQKLILFPGVIMEKIVKEDSEVDTNWWTNSPISVELVDAELSIATINDLPDSAFAYIEPGGKKDEEGKTVPRSLRHLPYKGADGKPDPTHVRNALARLSQTDIPASAKAEANKKLQAAAKELGIETAQSKESIRFEALEEGLNLYKRGLISKSLYQAILKEQGVMNAENDALADPERDEDGKYTGAKSVQNFTATPTTPKQENPKGQSTDANAPIGRDTQTAGVNAPQPAKSEQTFAGSALKTSDTGVGNPNSTVKPKMDYPLDMNPLAITNEGSSKLGNQITLTATESPNLVDAIAKAFTDTGVRVVRLGVTESKAKNGQ